MNMKDDYVCFDVGSKKDQIIKIAGTYETPYFCGKDVCTILDIKNIKDSLQTLDEDYKTNLKLVYELIYESEWLNRSNAERLIPLEKPTYLEGKAVYLNEGGLYSLIMRSRTKFAKNFQKFVCLTILPSIRKKGRFQLEQTIIQKDDKIDELTALVKQMDIRTQQQAEQHNKMLVKYGIKMDSLQEDVRDLKDQNEELLERNDELLERNDHLIEQNEVIQNKLGIAVEDRAPLPRRRCKQERFVLLKFSQKQDGPKPDHSYYTIRAQTDTAEKTCNDFEKIYNTQILLNLQCHPNSKSLYIRIKEGLKRRKVYFHYNYISLSKYESEVTEEELIDAIKDIDDEKRDIINL